MHSDRVEAARSPSSHLEGDQVFSDDARLLEGAPRLFGIVADAEEVDPHARHPQSAEQTTAHVVAWGHELPDQAVLTWRLDNGGCEVAVFSSAEAALATAQLLYPARLLWTQPAQVAPTHTADGLADETANTRRATGQAATPTQGAWYQ
jgi:hypothetical protein